MLAQGSLLALARGSGERCRAHGRMEPLGESGMVRPLVPVTTLVLHMRCEQDRQRFVTPSGKRRPHVQRHVQFPGRAGSSGMSGFVGLRGGEGGGDVGLDCSAATLGEEDGVSALPV